MKNRGIGARSRFVGGGEIAKFWERKTSERGFLNKREEDDKAENRNNKDRKCLLRIFLLILLFEL